MAEEEKTIIREADEKIIRLITQEGDGLEVKLSVAMNSMLIKNLLEGKTFISPRLGTRRRHPTSQCENGHSQEDH